MTFTIPGEPCGKGRPRVVRNGSVTRTYTPQKTAVYENLVKLEYQSQCHGTYFATEPLHMHLLLYYGLAKSDSKRNRLAKLNGRVRPTKKPDIDNCIKIIADALNGLAYRDDTQIVSVTAEKLYAENPHVEVTIEPIRLEQPSEPLSTMDG